ncbi:MAG: hypothetical protein ChlgKO_05250 [Chlamydiales bacterium]
MDSITSTPELHSFFELTDLNDSPVPDIHPFEPLEIHQDQPSIDSAATSFTSLLGPGTSYEADLFPPLQAEDITFLTASDTENQSLDEYTGSNPQGVNNLFDSLLGARTASEAGLPEHISTIATPTSPSINNETQQPIYTRPDIHNTRLILPKLYELIRNKDIERLKTRIPQIVAQKDFLEIALHFSIKNIWGEGVELFLRNGADPNWIDFKSGSSAINCSRYASHSKIFFSLLKAKANLRVANKKNMTVLHYAAAFGPLEVVKKICELAPTLKGIKNENEETPLDLALKKDINTPNRKFIIEHLSGEKYIRENLPRRRKRQKCSLRDKNPKSLLEEIKNIPEEKKQNSLDRLLHKKIKQRWTEGVEILLKEGASANSKNIISKNTALQVALYDGYNKIINLLFEYGARVDQLSGKGLTTMHIAAKHSCPSIIKKILDKSPEALLITDARGQTPLHVAFSRTKTISLKGISEILKHINSTAILLIKDNDKNRLEDLCKNAKIKQAIKNRHDILLSREYDRFSEATEQ